MQNLLVSVQQIKRLIIITPPVAGGFEFQFFHREGKKPNFHLLKASVRNRTPQLPSSPSLYTRVPASVIYT